MVSAKDIIVKPITAQAANALVKRVHYSGKVVNNSTLHFGAYLNDKLEGVMSFGSPLDKRKVLPLVEGTAWTGMLELNRMAFSDRLPRNSESRCMAVAFRLIKKHYPHIEWILSFSDGCQCGDGAIYRASGFVLTQIKKNTQVWQSPQGKRFSRTSLTDGRSKKVQSEAKSMLDVFFEAAQDEWSVMVGIAPPPTNWSLVVAFVSRLIDSPLYIPAPISSIFENGKIGTVRRSLAFGFRK